MTFLVQIECELDGVKRKKGDTFEAHDYLAEYFESRGIAVPQHKADTEQGGLVVEQPTVEDVTIEEPNIENTQAPKKIKK